MFRVRPRHACDVGLSFEGQATKTQQHLKKFTDINFMMQRAVAGDSSVFRRGFSGDFTVIPEDFQQILNIQTRARESYESLPNEVKRQYPSAEAFFAACHNPSEKDNLLRLGILKPAAEPDKSPVLVQVVNESSTDDAHAQNT